jgi:N-glycosylase/DNA lyase
LKQDPEYLHYRAIFPATSVPTPPASVSSKSSDTDDTLELIQHYFNLKPNLGSLYDQWAAKDANFRKKAPKFTGIRILQQDPWEALVGFICSSNNNIARISQMVDKLCTKYGPLIGNLGDTPYYDFPLPDTLVGSDVERHLQALGFGYRAKYIWKTACSVNEHGLDWLDGLGNPEKPVFGGPAPSSAGKMIEGGREGYRNAHEQLLTLQGVGPKVADCVCLMGLGWGESVPVDTHVWQIAQRDYKFGKGKHSSLTKATYDAIANKFRALWGDEAGWAQSVLFTANLKSFSERLVEKVEVKKQEILVKEEEGGSIVEETIQTTSRVSKKRVKREDEDEHLVLEVENIEQKSKRRKRKA